MFDPLLLISLLSLCSICIFIILIKIYTKLIVRWCKSQSCLIGKTVIITGANTGLGFETALDLAKRGARVILACRNQQLAEEARLKIIKETGNPHIIVKLIDLASFKSVRNFVNNINENEKRLDILINNAGAGYLGKNRSEDGHEILMQINYFSSFLLTTLLINLMKKTRNARIVNVSSLTAAFAFFFDLKKIDKFAELAKRLEGTGITTFSVHPGGVKTDFFRNVQGFSKLVLTPLVNMFFRTNEEGAQTIIFCSVSEGLEEYNGEHFDNCQKVKRYWTASKPQLSRELWDVTQELVELKPGEKCI